MCQGIIICLEEGKRRRSIFLLYKEGSDLCDFCPLINRRSIIWMTRNGLIGKDGGNRCSEGRAHSAALRRHDKKRLCQRQRIRRKGKAKVFEEKSTKK